MVLDSAHSQPKQKPERFSMALTSRLRPHGTVLLRKKSTLVKSEKTIDGVPPLTCFYHLPSDGLAFACPWVLSESIAQKASRWQPIGEPGWLTTSAFDYLGSRYLTFP